MKAYAAGDYAAALKDFSKYLDETRAADWKPGQADTEALFAYGKSRASVELAGARHLWEAKTVFEHYLRLKPADEQAETMLLDIYPRLNHNAEAVTLADDVLARRPNDVPALKARTKALIQRGLQQDAKFFTEALATGEKLNAAAPEDTEGHLLTQLAAASAKQPPEDVIAKAKSQVDDHPNDPRFELVLASAYVYANKLPEAAQWLRTAAARKAPDARFVDELVIRLDALGMFRDALPVLERAAADLGATDASLMRKLVQRQWQSGQYAAVAKRLEGLDQTSEKTDATLLGLRALALYAMNKGTEAAPIVDALDRRGKADSMAFAWSTALQARFGAAGLSPKEQVEKYKAALERDPANAVIHYLRGEAYSKLGENTLALDAWTESARRAPSWAAPRTRMAAALAGEGRYADAVRAAEDAYRRSSDDLTIVVVWAQAAYALLEQSPGQKELERLRARWKTSSAPRPASPTRCRSTRPSSPAAASSTPPPRWCARRSPPSPRRRRRCWRGWRRSAVRMPWGWTTKSPSASARRSPPPAAPTPAPARRSPRRWSATTPAARRKASTCSTAPAPRPAPRATRCPGNWRWRNTPTPSATRRRRRRGSSSPTRTPRTSPSSRPHCGRRARFQDREFWRRTIDRVKSLTVENSQLWRLEDARWLLTAPELSEQNQSNVLTTLHELARNAPQSPEPRRLLAVAYERSASAPGAAAPKQQEAYNSAVKAMQEACDLRPGDVGMVAELSRLMRTAGRGDEALKYLDRLAARPRLEPPARLRLADLYAEHGQPRRAIDVAAPLAGNGADPARGTDPSDAVVAATVPRLAKWHRALGEDDAAAALYRGLLTPRRRRRRRRDRTRPRRADDPRRRQLLRRPRRGRAGGRIPRPPRRSEAPARGEGTGSREVSERHAQQEAGKWYQAAAAAPGASAGVWRELAGFHLRHRRFTDALAAADAGLKQYDKDPDLLAMKARAGELEPLAENPVAQPLFSFLSFDPRNAPAVEMLSILRGPRDPKQNQNPGDTVAKLQAAADRSPNFLPLQVAAARGNLRLGDAARAEQLARRAAATFPDDVDAIRLLASVYAAQSKWPELRDTATNWRRLTPRDTLEPDLLLARVQLNSNDAAGAAARLEPFAKAEIAKRKPAPKTLAPK